MKKLILFFLIGFISLGAFSNEWKLYKEVDGVKIYYKEADCNHENKYLRGNYVIFKFENSTNKTLTVNWHADLYYHGVCETKDNIEYDYNLTLAPKEINEGDCQLMKWGFSQFKKVLTKEEESLNSNILTKFELTNITIK